jgi:prephenate dehydrogenase
MNQKVMVVGLGLIGASLSLCIKKEHPAITLIGWDYLEETRKLAIEQNIADQIPASFEQGAQCADIILFAVPVKTTLTYLAQLSKLPLKKGLIVTDASSTKQEVVNCGAAQSFTFIGGHPMAGSHKSGILAANPDLFENAYYIFTPLAGQEKEVAILQELFRGTRAKYVELTALEHDQVTGMLSHLPHIIAAGLVNQSDVFSQDHPRAKQLAAGGFRDITRIASSDPRMWTDILLSNKKELLTLLKQWQTQMEVVAGWIEKEDKPAIYHFFDEAKDTRDHLPIHQLGAIPSFYDLYVDVPDKPGIIAEVTTILGNAGLSLINLKIRETREDTLGIFEISFKTKKDLLAAKAVIEEKTNYHARTK